MALSELFYYTILFAVFAIAVCVGWMIPGALWLAYQSYRDRRRRKR